jgi:hypothetical protein
MQMRRKLTLALLGALAFAGCNDDSGSTPAAPTPPVAATPTPTPAPTATPGNPMASVSAKMFGWQRNEGSPLGHFNIPPSPPDAFQQTDWIDLDCTPRDADGRATPNHPAAIEWYYPGGPPGGLVPKDHFVVVDDNKFTPQVQLRYSAITGYFDIWCKVGSFESNRVRINVVRNPNIG